MTGLNLYLKYSLNFINTYLNNLEKCLKILGISKSKGTCKTKFPICPWCGFEQRNYETFLFQDIQVICCKKNTNNKFTVIRYKDRKDNVSYLTHKMY
jgi:hypothetical protein